MLGGVTGVLASVMILVQMGEEIVDNTIEIVINGGNDIKGSFPIAYYLSPKLLLFGYYLSVPLFWLSFPK